MAIVLVVLLVLSVVAVVSTVTCMARDGYRRVPTRHPGARTPIDR